MAKPERKRGRPPKGPLAEKHATLTTRIRNETRKALETAAQRAGLSLSQLVEILLRDALMFETRRKRTIQEFGGPETFALFRMMALAIRSLELGPTQRWFDSPYLHRKVVEAITLLLDQVKPEGEVAEPPEAVARGGIPDNFLASAAVYGVIDQILLSGDEPVFDEPGHYYSDVLKLGPHLKKWLGPLLKRLKPAPGYRIVSGEIRSGVPTTIFAIPPKKER